jgi:hypothetical protein
LHRPLNFTSSILILDQSINSFFDSPSSGQFTTRSRMAQKGQELPRRYAGMKLHFDISITTPVISLSARLGQRLKVGERRLWVESRLSQQSGPPEVSFSRGSCKLTCDVSFHKSSSRDKTLIRSSSLGTFSQWEKARGLHVDRMAWTDIQKSRFASPLSAVR